MAIAIYQETATSRKQWAESTSLSTLRKLASGEWVLFDATPADPPPAPDGLDAAAAALTANPASLLSAAQRAALLPFWVPGETVKAGDKRVNPGGLIVSRKADGTAGAIYDPTAWDVTSGGGGADPIPAVINLRTAGAAKMDGVTDDGATITAYLATAGPGAYGLPAGTCLLASAIVLTSRQSLVLSPATTLKRSSTWQGSLVTNRAAITFRQVTDGAIAAGSSTLTSATAAFTAADVGRPIRILGAGVSGLLLYTTVASVTDAGTAVISTPALTTVSAAGVNIYGARDADISIIGARGSLIDLGKSTAPGSSDVPHQINIQRADRVTVRGLTLTATAASGAYPYCINLGDVNHFHVADIHYIYGNKDGVHVQGPANNGVIERISGKTRDDLVAALGSEVPLQLNTHGPISNLIIRDIYGDASPGDHLIKLIAGNGQTMSNVEVDGVHGSCANSVVCIWDDPVGVGMTNGNMRGIKVENVDAAPTAGWLIDVSPATLDDLIIENLTYNGTGGTPSVPMNLVNSSSAITRLVLRDIQATKTVSNFNVLRNNGGSVTSLAASNIWLAGRGTNVTVPRSPGVLATSQTDVYTLTPFDVGTAVEVTSAAAVNVTVPNGTFAAGDVIEIVQYGAGQVTLVPGSGVTLRTSSSLTTRAQYSTISLRARSTSQFVVAGDLV